MGYSVMLWGAEKLVPAEYWCPYGRAANIGWEFGMRNARGRPLPAYKVAQVPKKLIGGGGGGGGGLQHFFFPNLKNIASILQAHTL